MGISFPRLLKRPILIGLGDDSKYLQERTEMGEDLNPWFYSRSLSIFAFNYYQLAAKTDKFQSPDYYLLDELLSDEHKLIRDTVRAYVKKEISPIIEEYAQNAAFPNQIVEQLGELGCFGPTIPEEYGGGGLDYISYGLMMQELERGDSGVRSTASVQGSLVMFPIHAYGNE